ncbi:MAG: exonuclease domain-containing protein [Patescibacteria group bacterium]
MRELIFLDTETTGNEPKTDRLCQVCYEVGGKLRTEYFKPPVPISVKAMSITHITNKMVENAEVFSQSEMKRELEGLLKEGVLVAHTAAFDIAMLKNEGLEVPRHICTLRVARYLDSENKIPEYNLQFLRYFLDLEVAGNAHDAEGDVNVLKALFGRLFNKVRESCGSDEEAIGKMIEISSTPSIFRVMPFGKHKGRLLEDVVKTDRSYLEWLLGQKQDGEEDEEDWIYTLKHYLNQGAST